MRTLELIGFAVLVVFCCAWPLAAAPVAETVYGRVNFEDGTPAIGARVKWLSLDPVEGIAPVLNHANEVVCAKDGAFRFEKMGKGPFRLEVVVRPTNSKTDMFTVLPKVAQGTPNLKIVLKCGSSVSGRVVDTKGSAVLSFKVAAIQRYKLGGPKDKPTATSGPDPRDFKDDDGRFVFECLPDGEWELFVTSGEATPPKTVRVTLPQTGEPITLIMPSFTEKQSITGRVVDPQGNPVAAANVRAMGERDKESGFVSTDDKSAKTDKDGVFHFEKLRTWPLRFSATAPGFGKTEVMRLEGSESLSEIVLELRPSCKLTGDVTDANGQPVADCIISVEMEGDEMSLDAPQTKTDAKGHFEMSDLAPGANFVAAYTGDSHPAGELFAAKRVTLAADAPATVKLKLKASKN